VIGKPNAVVGQIEKVSADAHGMGINTQNNWTPVSFSNSPRHFGVKR